MLPGRLLRLQSQMRHDLLQILPDFAFRGRIAQQVGWVIRGHQLRIAIVKPVAAESRNGVLRLQQGLRGECRRDTRSLSARSRPAAGTDTASTSRPHRPPACDFPAGGTSPRCRCRHHPRCRPIASIICVSNFPARPQTAIPGCLRRVRGLPRQTRVQRVDSPLRRQYLFRCFCSRQRVHSPRSSRIRSSVSPSTRSRTSNSDGAFTTGMTGVAGAAAFTAAMAKCSGDDPGKAEHTLRRLLNRTLRHIPPVRIELTEIQIVEVVEARLPVFRVVFPCGRNPSARSAGALSAGILRRSRGAVQAIGRECGEPRRSSACAGTPFRFRRANRDVMTLVS